MPQKFQTMTPNSEPPPRDESAASSPTLTRGSSMRRGTPDDFGLPQTAFNVCAFCRVDALVRIGRTEARESFGALLAHRNPMGLLSEDLDPKNGRLWGNFLQTIRRWGSSTARCCSPNHGVWRCSVSARQFRSWRIEP
jgi:hypothetical protein